jgi:hypothetical protein
MKKFFFTTLIALSLVTVAWAYPRPDFDTLFGQWNLTAQQIEELQGYFEQYRSARHALRQQDFTSREDRHAAMGELREQHRRNLATVLSAEQLEEFDLYWEQFRGHRGDHKGPGYGGRDFGGN